MTDQGKQLLGYPRINFRIDITEMGTPARQQRKREWNCGSAKSDSIEKNKHPIKYFAFISVYFLFLTIEARLFFDQTDADGAAAGGAEMISAAVPQETAADQFPKGIKGIRLFTARAGRPAYRCREPGRDAPWRAHP